MTEILEEKKGKKGKGKGEKETEWTPTPLASYDPAFDFSQPLGQSNLYKAQGGVNWGPYTGALADKPAYEIDDETLSNPTKGKRSKKNEGVGRSVWDALNERFNPDGSWGIAAKALREADREADRSKWGRPEDQEPENRIAKELEGGKKVETEAAAKPTNCACRLKNCADGKHAPGQCKESVAKPGSKKLDGHICQGCLESVQKRMEEGTFGELEHSLAHQKGVHDPKKLAGFITNKNGNNPHGGKK